MNEFIFQLVNRQNGSKLKPTMSTIYDEEVVKHASSHRSSDYSKPVTHTIWTDPDVSWNDKSFESNSNKVKRGKQYQVNWILGIMYLSWIRSFSDFGRQVLPGQEIQYVRQLAIRVERLLLQSFACEQQIWLRQYHELVEPSPSRLRHEFLNGNKLQFLLPIPRFHLIYSTP